MSGPLSWRMSSGTEVASGPMAAPGWYPDPTGQRGPRGQRYWDGQRWLDVIPTPPPPRPPGGGGSTWKVWIAVGAGALLLLYIAGSALVSAFDQGSEDEKPAASTPTSSRARSTSVPGSPIPPSPGEAYKIGGFGNPYFEGIYEAPGGPDCWWVVQRDLVGDASSVISRGGSGQRPRVGLRDGQYFTSDGCGTWKRVGRL
ncbi:DUF2510 domain-containing protein [Mycolicibacterium sp. A43C]